MRLTERNTTSFFKNIKYFPSKELKNKEETEIGLILLNKVGEIEDLEAILKKLVFYGKVYQYPGQIMALKFNKIYHGHENTNDIRIDFKLKNGLGNVFYNVFEYGKTWALTEEELL